MQGSGYGSMNRSGALFLAASCILISVLLMLVPTMPNLVGITLTLALAAIPVVLLMKRIQLGNVDYFEIILPLSFLYFLYFGASYLYLWYNPQEMWRSSLYPYLTPAVGLALLGLISLLAGYLICFRNTQPSAIGNLQPRGLIAILLPGVLGIIGQFATAMQERHIQSGGGINILFSTFQQFSPLFFFSWFMASYAFWAKRLNRLQSLVLMPIFLVAVIGIIYLSVGSKEKSILLLLIPTVSFWYARRKLPLKTIIAIALIGVFVIFPLYNTYRLQQSSGSTIDRLDDTLAVTSKWDSRTYLHYSYEAFLKRMGIITSLAAILKDVGTYVDYKYGETLFLVPISVLIPRFLWPDKPNINIGREFAVTFQLVSAVDRSTKIAPSFVGDFYWNFHIPGVIVGMFLFGAGLHWFYRKYGWGGDNDIIRKGIYVTLALRLIHFEGNVAGIVAGSLKTVLIIYALIFVMRQLGLLVFTQSPTRQAEGPLAPRVPGAPLSHVNITLH